MDFRLISVPKNNLCLYSYTDANQGCTIAKNQQAQFLLDKHNKYAGNPDAFNVLSLRIDKTTHVCAVVILLLTYLLFDQLDFHFIAIFPFLKCLTRLDVVFVCCVHGAFKKRNPLWMPYSVYCLATQYSLVCLKSKYSLFRNENLLCLPLMHQRFLKIDQISMNHPQFHGIDGGKSRAQALTISDTTQ